MNNRRKLLAGIALLLLIFVCGALAGGVLASQFNRSGVAFIRNLPTGAMVVAAERSALERMGLQTGDMVTAVNGVQVNESKHLGTLIQSSQPGDTIELTVTRDTQKLLISAIVDSEFLTFAANADADQALNSLALQAKAQAGDMVTAVAGVNVDANHSLAVLILAHKPGETVSLQVRHGPETLGISTVIDSALLDAAAKTFLQARLNQLTTKAGLQAGDEVTAVGGVQVNANHTFAALIRAHKPGDLIALTIERGGKPLTLSIKVDSQLIDLAAQAGLQPGDVLVQIGGLTSRAKESLAVEADKNASNATVDVTVKRGSELLNLTIDIAVLVK